MFPGFENKTEKLGLAYSGTFRAEQVKLLIDETWVDADGMRGIRQEIFDSILKIINAAEQFILLDFFLVNEFLYEPGPGMRNLSRELSDQLVAKRNQTPEVKIIFITDPVNTGFGSVESPLFSAMQEVGVQVVWTDLDKLRDSNPLISKPWRLLVRPFGTGPGDAFENPMGKGRISRRSLFKLLNFKANHRKVVVTEKSVLVSSANPHSASSAHWNAALRIDGAGQELAIEAESAILNFSGAGGIAPSWLVADDLANENELELLTECRIKEKVLKLLDEAQSGYRIDLSMFYLSHRDIIRGFVDAKKRGCNVRIILDPAKDAFGRIKNGIPNRQSAGKLIKAGIPLRWADTHGEQCHIKMLYVEHPDNAATLLLGSCNYTRRNMDNFNCECDLALTASTSEGNMQRAREVFDRWWSNADGRGHTVEYKMYEDTSVSRRLRAWLMERTGMGTF